MVQTLATHYHVCKREAFPVSSNNEPTGHMIRHDIDGEGLTAFARFVVAALPSSRW
jgi:hypothetical protein